MNMSDPLINSIVNCLVTVKEISPELFDTITQKVNSVEDEKKQLLQEDQNLAQDMADLQTNIADHDKAIEACHAEIALLNKKIKSLNGSRGNLIKQLNTVNQRREEVWKQWNMKKAQPLKFDADMFMSILSGKGGTGNAH